MKSIHVDYSLIVVRLDVCDWFQKYRKQWCCELDGQTTIYAGQCSSRTQNVFLPAVTAYYPIFFSTVERWHRENTRAKQSDIFLYFFSIPSKLSLYLYFAWLPISFKTSVILYSILKFCYGNWGPPKNQYKSCSEKKYNRVESGLQFVRYCAKIFTMYRHD